jgi:luciferase family oxidoreductase group 1
MIGAGFAFAHHFATHDAVAAMTSYRNRFRPGAALDRPRAILAVAAIAADTDAEAERLAATIDHNFVRRQKGEYLPLASPEEAAAYPYSPAERERIRQNRDRVFTGTVATLRARLDPLIEATAADEVMATTMIYDHAARRHSYELLARAYGLSGAVPVASAAVPA